MYFCYTAGFIKWLCSLLVCDMWPTSGTFFRCSRYLYPLILTKNLHVLTAVCVVLGWSRLRRGPQPGLLTTCVKQEEQVQKKTVVGYEIKSSKETLYNKVLKIHSQRHKWTRMQNSLALPVTELYYGSCLSVQFCQKKNELKSTMYC